MVASWEIILSEVLEINTSEKKNVLATPAKCIKMQRLKREPC